MRYRFPLSQPMTSKYVVASNCARCSGDSHSLKSVMPRASLTFFAEKLSMPLAQGRLADRDPAKNLLVLPKFDRRIMAWHRSNEMSTAR
jgi:hypothetical protein